MFNKLINYLGIRRIFQHFHTALELISVFITYFCPLVNIGCDWGTTYGAFHLKIVRKEKFPLN